MTHFTLTVEVPPEQATDAETLSKYLDRALAPFDENAEVVPYKSYEKGGPEGFWAVETLTKDGLLDPKAPPTWAALAEAYNEKWPGETKYHVDADGMYQFTTYNPNSKWDWWVVGGRWSDRYLLRKGTIFNAHPAVSHLSRGPLRSDGGPVGAIDFVGMRAEATAKANGEFDEWERIVAEHGEPAEFSTFLSKHGDDYAAARTAYHQQPGVQAMREGGKLGWLSGPEDFAMGRETYVRRAAQAAVHSYAYLTRDGSWMAPGEMGWFGMSSETEADKLLFYDQADEWLAGLSPDTVLVSLDLHI